MAKDLIKDLKEYVMKMIYLTQPIFMFYFGVENLISFKMLL